MINFFFRIGSAADSKLDGERGAARTALFRQRVGGDPEGGSDEFGVKFDDGAADEFDARVVDDHFHAVLNEDDIGSRIHLHTHFEFVLISGTASAFHDDAKASLVDFLQTFDTRIGDHDGRFSLGWRERRSGG